MVLLYHNFRPLFTHSLFFPWPINYDHAFRCHKSPTHSLSTQFGKRSFHFCLKLWRCVWPRFIGLKLCK
jgi:hypothetical protein